MAIDKKKLQTYAAIVIVPGVIGMAIYTYLQQNSVPLGGECSNREQCKAPADACMQLESTSVCTVECHSGGCPAGLECVEMNVTINSIDTHGSYCIPSRIANAGAKPH